MELKLTGLTKGQIDELQTAIGLRIVELTERTLTKGFSKESVKPFIDWLIDIQHQISEQTA